MKPAFLTILPVFMGVTDPVAIDQAGIDMVSVADGNEKLMQRIADKNGLHILESAEKIGVGTRKYKLVDLDEK